MLADLDHKRDRLEKSMLRIAGAVQVLEELAGPEVPAAAAEEQRNNSRDGDPLGD